jgi:hypothetical protein
VRETDQLAETITALQHAAAIFRETGDRHREGIAPNNLSIALQEVRWFTEAIAACQDAAAIFRETGDEYLERIALGNLDEARAARQPDPAGGPANAQPCWSAVVRADGVFVIYGPPDMTAQPLSASAAAISMATCSP